MFSARHHAGRGQGGFVVMAGLAVWLLVGGVIMLALMNMTIGATKQATIQREFAQQVRAIEGAMDTAIATIQVDPSGRTAAPSGKEDGTCAAGLARPDDALTVDDGLGNDVTVTAKCWGPTKVDGTLRVELIARLESDAARRGNAELEVTKARGPGYNVTILSWSIDTSPRTPGTTTTTTTPPTTITTTTTTTTTIPPTTTTTPGGVTWTSRVSAEWQNGYCLVATIRNGGPSPSAWTIQVPVRGTIYTSWGGAFTRSGGTLTVGGLDWNRVIPAGGSTEFGFCSNT